MHFTYSLVVTIGIIVIYKIIFRRIVDDDIRIMGKKFWKEYIFGKFLCLA